MAYVQEHRAAELLASSKHYLYSWTIVDQGGGKWRAPVPRLLGTWGRIGRCRLHTLRRSRCLLCGRWGWWCARARTLPSVIMRHSFRDAFWHSPSERTARNPPAPGGWWCVILAYPGTGQLSWAYRFAYTFWLSGGAALIYSVRSQTHRCGELIQILRVRAAGRDIHIYLRQRACPEMAARGS